MRYFKIGELYNYNSSRFKDEYAMIISNDAVHPIVLLFRRVNIIYIVNPLNLVQMKPLEKFIIRGKYGTNRLNWAILYLRLTRYMMGQHFNY